MTTAQLAQRSENVHTQSWQRRKKLPTKTDTERWITDNAAAVAEEFKLAPFRRGEAVRRGYPEIFAKIHARRSAP